MADRHEITFDVHRDPKRPNWVRIHLACSTPNCTIGKVTGSPAEKLIELVERMRDDHLALGDLDDEVRGDQPPR